MKETKTYICLLIYLCLAIATNTVNAQSAAFYSTEQLAASEQKNFSGNRSDKGHSDTRTVASVNFDINFYRCEWTIDPNILFIKGRVTACFTVTAATDNIVFDLSDTLTVDSVIFRGAKIGFSIMANDGLQLIFPVILPTAQKDSVSIYYNGVPRNYTSFRPFVKSAHNGDPMIYTLSEPFGAKEWWPCKNGLNDKADSIDITITSPLTYKGVSNGLLTKEATVGVNRITYFQHRYPIATYLVGIAVANYVTSIDSIQSGSKKIPLITNAYPENENDFKYAAYSAKQSMTKFSELFGEYPFIKEQYSQTQIGSGGGGGIEHQTNSFIGNTWNQLVAHELGHQWFGNQVTCGSWQHIWLNEGFGNYMQFIYVQHFDTALIVPHLKYYLNLITSKTGGSVFVQDTADAARIFDSRLTYAKGGYAVHMLRGVLGDSLFFKGLRQYLNDPSLKNKFAVTADLKRNLEAVSGKNLQSFFQKWIYGEGYANYNCTWTQNRNNWAKVQINQTTSHPSVSFYDMPVQLQFRNSNRDTTITVNDTRNEEIFWINVGFQADTMLVDPRYWILAKDRLVKKIPASSNQENEIRIYPNPATDHLTVLILNPSVPQINIQLYTIIGQRVYNAPKILTGRDEALIIPTSHLAKGIYVLTVAGNIRTITKRIVVK
ncbi:MAG: M1 family aminopeptidase [Chitinophagaceae bacterium]